MKFLFWVSLSAVSFGADLFDGKTLKGWQQCNGTAQYKVEDGTIVGTTAVGSPNSFLCTDREYGDFVLEYEAKADVALNSGVQIRGHKYERDTVVRTFNGKETRENKREAGRIHGYQVEIASGKSGASGSIYDEARRGWIAKSPMDAPCATAFKDNDWNRFRVEAKADVIRTWLNDVPCANLVDSMDLTGVIALQVHSYKGEKPAQVRWRNIKITDMGKHVWRPIWDGKSLDAWTKAGGADWTVTDNAIRATSKADDGTVGFLVSPSSYKDVTARVRFKMIKGNSGFFVRADPKTRAGYEVEIDDAKRTGGFWESGGRRWVAGPEDNANVIASDWNELTAHLHGRRIVFHLNGAKTIDLANDEGRLEGHIALQAHGAKRPTEVWFKDLAVLEPEGKAKR